MKLSCEVCGWDIPEGTGSKGGAVRCGYCKQDYWGDRPIEDIRAHAKKLERGQNRMEWNLSRRSAKARSAARARVAQIKTKVRESVSATRH